MLVCLGGGVNSDGFGGNGRILGQAVVALALGNVRANIS
jgi:hypothetical protein